MALARTHSVALVGVEGHLIYVEADIAQGLPATIVVGLPDTALREARDRIRAAIVNSGESWPQTKITVGLSPASLPKRGSGFDLAIAVAILAAAGGLPLSSPVGKMFLAELGLDGRLRPVPGVLPAVVAAEPSVDAVVVAAANRAEARLVPGVRVVAASTRGRPVKAPEAGSRGGPWPVRGADGRRDLRGRRAQPVAARAARGGQNHACRAAADDLAQAGDGRGARGHYHPFGGGDATARRGPADRAAV